MTILTHADGTPFSKPRRADFRSDVEYAQAFHGYGREIERTASSAVYEMPRASEWRALDGLFRSASRREKPAILKRRQILGEEILAEERRTTMPKLRGLAKKKFLARMAKGRKKAGHGTRKKKGHKKTARKKTSRRKSSARRKTTRKSHHKKRFGSMAHMLSGGSPSTAKAVKHMADKLGHEMSVMKRRLEKECATALRKAKKHPGRKKARRKSPKRHGARRGPKTHHVRDVASHRYGRRGMTSVSAGTIVKGAKNKTWTCAGPRRTGCGGGSRGGHVLGRVRR